MIYLDNHATTPIDPVALEAMLPYLSQEFANAGSVTHAAGRKVAQAVAAAVAGLAASIGSEPDEIVITSGATESNNLALQGVLHHPRQNRRKVVSHHGAQGRLDLLNGWLNRALRCIVCLSSNSRKTTTDRPG